MNPSGRRRVGAVVILVAVAGCARAGGRVGGSAVRSERREAASHLAGSSATPRSGGTGATGTVTGVAREWGGPLLPNGHMAAEGTPVLGLTLVATQNDRPIATTVTGSDGGFRFTLTPGSYVVTGCADLTVVVLAGQVNHQDISCPIP